MAIRQFRGPAAALALLLGVTACTGTNNTPTDPSGGTAEEAVTLRYLIEELEDAAAKDRLRERLDVFESENPGITVQLDSMPFNTMRTVLQTQLRSGDGPDVFNWGSGPSFGGALAEAGLLYDLNDAYEEYGWEVYDFAKEQVTYDGMLYGVPGEMETIGVFYNKDLFAELGIEEPTDLGEFEAAAKAVKDAGLIPVAVSDQDGWQGGHLLSIALSSRIGSDGMADLIDGTTSWDSPDVTETLRLWSDYHAAGYLTPFPTAVSYDSGNSLFDSGQAAMIPTGSWRIDGIAANADFEAGYIPFPAEDGPGIFSGGLGSGPMISAATQHPEAAVKLLDFLASPEHGRWMVDNLDVIPPFPIDTEGLDISPLFAQVLADTARLASGQGDFGVNIDVLMGDAFNEAMFDGMQAILSEQASPEEVAQRLEAAVAQ